MSRKQRVDPVDGWHHVMNRGVDRQRIFFDDVDRIEYGRCLALACRRFGVEVHAYCLMDNHFHLLLRCPGGHVSDVMHLTCGLYAAFVNKRLGRVGHLFGDRFCSRLVTTSDYIAAAVRYIHRNALDLPGVSSCRSYRWSSHQRYLGLRSAADWMRTDVVLGWFDSPAGFESFVERDASTSPTRRRGPEVAALLGAVDLVTEAHSTLAGRAVRTQRRAVALELAGDDDRLASPVHAAFGATTDSAKRAARRRASEHLRAHPETSQLAARVADLVSVDSLQLRPAS